RLRQIRLGGGAQAPALQVGQESQSASQVKWLIATAVSLALLPWYTTEGTWWGASALLHGFQGRPWLLGLLLSPPAVFRRTPGSLMLAGAAGVLLMLLQGFLFRHPNITPEGWPTQPGMGYGALAAGI